METVLRTLKAGSDSTRLRILRILGSGPFNVAELTEILGVGQSTVSRHLRILSEAGLVEVRRTGTWAFYSRPGAEHGLPAEFLGFLDGSLNGAEPGDRRAVDQILNRRRRETSDFFRETARVWDRVRDEALGPPTHLGRLVDWVDPGGTVVDLGTGTGVLLSSLAESADHVIGVDASPEMLDVARQRISADELTDTELRLGTLEHLPLSDAEADTMVANLVLHHVADPPEVLREIHRGLSPDGRLVVADLCEHEEESFWRTIGARWPGFRRADLEDWLSVAGFQVRRFETTGDSDSKHPAVFLLEARKLNDSVFPTTRGGTR